MKKIATALLAIGLAASAATPAFASTCIDTLRIRDTKVIDSKHILFKMNDGTVWNAALKQSCPGLLYNGFEYRPFADREICENAQSIRALQSGQVCMLGAFTKQTPPPKT